MKQLLKRELKIYEKYLINNKKVPEVRLVGLWLKKYGFNPGDKISVEFKDEKLIIEKIPVVEVVQTNNFKN